MKTRGIRQCIPLLLGVLLLLGGPVQLLAEENGAAAADQVYKGKVVGKSNKAKTISIEVKGSVEMVKFDDQTTGIEHAAPGEAAIIKFEKRGKDRFATVIKPKLAKLPPGVTEMSVEELASLVAQGREKGNYFLVDSRPAQRYAQGHIPTAVGIPVNKLEKTGAALLPGDARIRDMQLIFYCGGPT